MARRMTQVTTILGVDIEKQAYNKFQLPNRSLVIRKEYLGRR